MNSSVVMAPVLIFTYIRIDHLRKTISALQSNPLAKQTDLFVASDFQRTDAEAKEVSAVRDFLKSIVGFKSVTLLLRDRNLGAAENCFSALNVIFVKFDCVILMEDDIVTAPGFLQFINDALKKYSANEKVFSVTGYCPPIEIPGTYQYDAFFFPRMSAWGCGITKEMFKSVREITPDEYDQFVSNKKLSEAFVKGGEDLLVMLKDVAYGLLDAWDVRCMYTQFLNDQYTVYPSQSLVSNIGFDGTGIHCGKTDQFDVALSDRTEFSFPDDIYVDQRIVKSNYQFRKKPGPEEIVFSNLRKLIRKGTGKCLRYIRSFESQH